MNHRFADRGEAARALAARLADEHLPPPVVVLALPRGGVPIGAEIARRLGAPLDVLLVRKIGAPWQREIAVAAVVDGPEPDIVIDEQACDAGGADMDYVRREAAGAMREIERRREAYQRGRAPLSLLGATVIVVDDGIATGATMRAALKAVRRRGAARIVLAVPVAPHETLFVLRNQVDRTICLAEPMPFRAIARQYVDFAPVGDEEVAAALDAAAARVAQHGVA